VSWKRALRRVLGGLRLSGVYALRDRLRRWAPERLVREGRFRRWNRRAAADVMVVRPGIALHVDARARESFEWFCFRSHEMARELDAFLRRARGRRRFLDLGACHGIFSLAFTHGRPGATALAVEPSAPAFAILAANAAAAEPPNVQPRQVACGAAAGTLRMRQVWHHLEAVSDGDDPGTAAPGEVLEVATTTVDALCGALGFAPDLVKIDVEGYELAVLRGARETLVRHRPEIFLEIHPGRLHELGASPAELVRLLEDLGYGFSRLGGAALPGRRVAALRDVTRLVCTPREAAAPPAAAGADGPR
jgi:FkbM family methyltransferase